MAYSYTPPSNSIDDEEQKRLAAQQPAATIPTPSSNGDPFQRNVTAVEGNTESRYGGYLPKSTVQTEPGPKLELGTFGNVGPASAPPPLVAGAQAAGSRASQADAFDSNLTPKLLVPSPAVAEAQPPAVTPPPPQPVRVPGPPPLTATPPIAPVTPAATSAAAAIAPVSQAAPPLVTPTPIPGTLPGSTPQANALPAAPRPILPPEEDPYRRRRTALA